MSDIPMIELRNIFGERLQENVKLSNYTTVQIGGRTDALLIAHSAAEMETTIRSLWDLNVPFFILGSGSNVLLSEKNYHGVALVNRAQGIKIDVHGAEPSVLAESGANLIRVANQTALRGLSGLEWASGIPGSVGGAVIGNAGAFGNEIKNCLLLAEILHRSKGKELWPIERFRFGYRTSVLKQNPGEAFVLSARFKLQNSTAEEVQSRIADYWAKRQKNTPQGASMGCMFKNPPGGHAGKLIEAAGLKGVKIGGVEISDVHANFFINHGNASDEDYRKLIALVQKTVKEKFNVDLELEVQIFNWFD